MEEQEQMSDTVRFSMMMAREEAEELQALAKWFGIGKAAVIRMLLKEKMRAEGLNRKIDA